MAKSFRDFCDETYDNEWDNEDGDVRQKDRKLQSRRDQRRRKNHEKYAAIAPIKDDDE